MTTPSAREALYHQLTKVLGHGPAETMMSYLPEQQPATKADISELRAEMREFRTEFRTDLRHLHDTIHAQTRVHVAASLGSAVTVAGLVFIAAQVV